MDSVQSASPVIAAPGPSPGFVRAQLDRVLRSRHFAEAPRLSRFLAYLVEQHIAGTSTRLKGYNIAVDVFDRAADFDPATDTIVRVQAGQLRRRLERYYASDGLGDPLRIEVPKGCYAPLITTSHPACASTGRLPATIERPPCVRPRALPTVAVAPLVAICGSPDAQRIAEALTTEIVAALARFRHLSVLSRVAATGRQPAPGDATRPGMRREADLLLEGTVRLTDRRVGVSFELSDVTTGTVELSDRLQPSTGDAEPCAAVDEAALRIAARVADRHGPIAGWRRQGRDTVPCEPWETYRRAMRRHRLQGVQLRETHRLAREALASALDADPLWSDGWASLAIVRLDEYRHALSASPGVAILDDALRCAREAIACDPGHAMAHGALAIVHHFRREGGEFAVAADRAAELNPADAELLAELGLLRYLRGDRDRGLAMIDRAIDLAPLDPGWHRYPRAIEHALRGRFDLALQEVRMANSPGLLVHQACMAWFSAELGAWLEAAKATAALLAMQPDVGRTLPALLARWWVHPSLCEPIVAGLRLAGVAIER